MTIKLADRIKEISYTIGTGNMILSGAVNGFSSFSSYYDANDNLFYAITDGTDYEIGSGIFKLENPNKIIRFPLVSTNSNSLVNFDEGLKEVYVTYPATHSVYMGSGIGNNYVPLSSGVAFWSSSNSLDYDSQLTWDKNNHNLGIKKSNPVYAIDIGGSEEESIVNASGYVVSSSGITFPSGNNSDSSYIGGVQLTHYEMNRLDQYAYDNSLINHLTGSDAVIELSGSANQYILFKQQQAGLVFAGPSGGCNPPCSPAYPNFRPLVKDDMLFLDDSYTSFENLILVSGILNTKINSTSGILNGRIDEVSGVLNNKIDSVSGILNNRINTVSGILNSDLIIVSGIASSNSDNTNIVIVSGMCVSSSGILRNDLITSSGALRSNDTAISGYFQSKTQNITQYSPTAMGLTGNVGINYTPRTDCALSSRTTGNNKFELYGSVTDCANYVYNDDNLEYNNAGSYIISRPIVQDGVFNSGVSIGSIIINQRNNSDPNDNGTLADLYGLNVAYGHNKAFPQSPMTNTAVGLSISCYALSGIIDNAYDFVLASSGENTNNHWGIFQISPNDNYFAGRIGLDTQNPTASLDMQTDIFRLRTPKTPANKNDNGNTGDICWDNSYIYVCVAENSWKRSQLNDW
jgi:hypothetical protein